MSPVKRVLMYLLSGMLAFTGFSHLLNPAFFVVIMPPGLPSPEWLNVICGLAEIVLGVFLLEPRVRVFAAWGIIALLIAVYPANVYVALENVGVPGGEPGTGNAIVNWLRMPFQLVFVAWAWWYTRPEDAQRAG